MLGSYYGIWASVIKAFSEESLRESMLTAAQINEYEQARHPVQETLQRSPSVRTFQETALLSERQREIMQEIMDETSRRMVVLGIFLIFFIGWGSIFLTHKIAGPIFKLRQRFRELEFGNLTARIKFRKFDEIHRLAESFNTAAATLDANVGKMKRIVREHSRESMPDELKKELAKFKTTAD